MTQAVAVAAARPRRRRIKVRGGHLGPFLCWAVVFADIGTSVYYVPGILYSQFASRAAIFVLMTLVVFILLSLKYAEVAWRYPEGGGVVTVASRALHPFAGLLGGLFILVDYYLTAALSALSGVLYLAVIIPALGPNTVAVVASVVALIALGVLNVIGIKESAVVSATVATLAGIGQLLVVGFTAVHLGPGGIVDSIRAVGHGPALTPITLIVGYSAAFLAFSGLESIAQVSPAMREPRNRTAYRAMALVIATMAITSPLLTLWSTTTLPRGSDPNQFISLLGLHVGGSFLGDYVAISGSVLLIFASNTAIIGAYHVFLALTRMGFLPRVMERRNRVRHTPHWAVVAAVALPIAVLIAVSGSVNLLGDLYAFGLLAAFVLTCLSLDLVRWRDGVKDVTLLQKAGFALGVMTTIAVLVAWCVNLVAKPLATEFGGGLTVLGLLVGFATYRYNQRRRPAVFPVPYRRAGAAIIREFRRRPADVLVILPHDPEDAQVVLDEAVRIVGNRSVVYLYRGGRPQMDHADLFEVNDPYLKDYHAQDSFARAEQTARKARINDRRYVYLSGSHHRDVVGDAWREVRPRETVASEVDFDVLPPIALDRVRRHRVDNQTVLHMFTGRLPRAAAAGA
ncbi:MAG TPA: APC family permease [Candidatus Dormibacteraeota bacterium]